MFKFTLPKFAAFEAVQPNGGNLLFIHLGEGKFISQIPPLMSGGVAPEAEVVDTDPAITFEWDSETFQTSKAVMFMYDAKGALALVEAAAAAGDKSAINMLGEFDRASKIIEAREAVGMTQ